MTDERPKDTPREKPREDHVDSPKEGEDRIRPHDLPPDRRPISRAQAAYLAEISDVPAEKLVGRPIGVLDDLLKWKIDPELLFFRRVCGRVVRRDPGSGVIQGVPNATVHVEDTDCSFLGFFPVENPAWWWFWPISCNREVIATTTTDECGNFCVYLPRWDIDRILRFRLQRICFPEIVRPNLRDIIEDLRLEPKRRFPIDPNPPDPPVPAARRGHAPPARLAGRARRGRAPRRHLDPQLRCLDGRADRGPRAARVHRGHPAGDRRRRARSIGRNAASRARARAAHG